MDIQVKVNFYIFMKESLNKSINIHENNTFKPQINKNSKDKLIG